MADPSRVLFVEARYDICMTQQSRDDLWEVLGRPERIAFGFRHRRTFYAMTPLGFNVLGRYATRFFEDRFLDQKPSVLPSARTALATPAVLNLAKATAPA